MDKIYTTKTAAKELGVTPDRIRQMLRAERLIAQKIGRDWVISQSEIDRVRDRKPGRPRNNSG